MMEINNQYVIIDHTWLWRADHDIAGSVKYSRNYVENGLQVNADNVKAFGLFSEHNLGDLVQWNGNNGEVYFYQSELPYDVTQQNYADKGYAGFYLGDSVTNFRGYGVAVYTYFRDHTVWQPEGIKVSSSSSGIHFQNSYIRYLNGDGGLNHVLNGEGKGVKVGDTDSYLCSHNAYSLSSNRTMTPQIRMSASETKAAKFNTRLRGVRAELELLTKRQEKAEQSQEVRK